MYDPTDNLNI